MVGVRNITQNVTVGEGESFGVAHDKYQLMFLMRAGQLFTSPGNMCHSKFKWGGGRVEGLNVMVGEWGV
jgi:hypothetical protein